MKNQGIYTITCTVNNKIYVGYALDFKKRKEQHFRELSNNHHKNIHLQASYNKHGKDKFIFEILEECDGRFLATQEHYWCIMLYTHNSDFGYNIRPTHPYNKTINTPEIRAKISKSKIGKIPNWTEDFKKRRSEKLKERGWTKEEIEKSALKRRKPIICLSKDGNFIKEYSSGRDVQKDLGISYKHVSSNCRHKCKTCKGYIFMFKEEFENYINNGIVKLKS